MNSLIAQAEAQRDQSYLTYKTWKFAADILRNLAQEYRSPVGLYPSKDFIFLTIPANKNTITVRDTEWREGICSNIDRVVEFNIKPDPIEIARNMNVTLLPNPIIVPMVILVTVCEELTDYEIANDTGTPYDPRTSEYTGVSVPRTILKEIAKEIGPRLDKEILDIHGSRYNFTGYFNFTWPVHLVVPPLK